jgi:hypothetical protein
MLLRAPPPVSETPVLNDWTRESLSGTIIEQMF